MRASHRIVSVLAFMAAACTGLSGCGTKDTAAVVVPTDLPGLQSVGLHQVWQRQVPLETGERITKVWRLGLSVYVATSGCRIVRLDAKTGILKWGVALGYENFDIFRPVELKGPDNFPNGEVLVITRGEAFIFNMEIGDENAARMGISASTDPVVIGNTLCVGGADTFYGMYMDRLGIKACASPSRATCSSRRLWRWTATCWSAARRESSGASRPTREIGTGRTARPTATSSGAWRRTSTRSTCPARTSGLRLPHRHRRRTLGAAIG